MRIDYFNAAMAKVTPGSVILWMALSSVTGLGTYRLYKRGKLDAPEALLLPVLVFYLSFALTITLFERMPQEKAMYELKVFWSYESALAGETQLFWENLWNVILFIPVGTMGALLRKKSPWRAALFGVLLSVGIEIAQLLLRLGLFEFDDIIHNSLGAVIGVGLSLLWRRARS